MATTKCSIIRDTATAMQCGLCSGKPVGCPASVPAAVCSVPSAANDSMSLFAARYNPSNLFLSAADKTALTQEEKNYQSGIQASATQLAAAYPNAAPGATTITWPDFERCLWTPQGLPGGPFNNKYFMRNDVQTLGMQPTYPIGKTFAQGVLWKNMQHPSPVPVSVDYVMNPDLAVIIIFALLVIIFAVLIWQAYRDAKSAPYRAEQKKEAERQKLEAADPFKGTAFESYPDPQAKCREYVEAQEAQGYDMAYYRQRCGLPSKPE